MACPDAELSILIVDDAQIEALNRDYLNRTGPTNVIAFPMREGRFTDITPELLGDVVISVDTAQREGRLADMGLQERFTELLVHGVLHLLGYDHENDEAQAEEMESKSLEILDIIRTKNLI